MPKPDLLGVGFTSAQGAAAPNRTQLSCRPPLNGRLGLWASLSPLNCGSDLGCSCWFDDLAGHHREQSEDETRK